MSSTSATKDRHAETETPMECNSSTVTSATKLVPGIDNPMYSTDTEESDSSSMGRPRNGSTLLGQDDIQRRQQTMIDLREEQTRLEKRVMELQEEAHQIQTDNSVMKMKATLTLGSMKLEIDSLEEDRNCLIEKLFAAHTKLRESKNDLAIKQKELETLKEMEKRRREVKGRSIDVTETGVGCLEDSDD